MESELIQLNIAQKFVEEEVDNDTVMVRVQTNRKPMTLVFSQKYRKEPYVSFGPYIPNTPWDVVGIYDYNRGEQLLKKVERYRLDTIIIHICNSNLRLSSHDVSPKLFESCGCLLYENLLEDGGEQRRKWLTERKNGVAFGMSSEVHVKQIVGVKDGPIRYTLKHKNAPFSFQLFNVNLQCVKDGVMTFDLKEQQAIKIERSLFKFLRGVFFSHHSERHQFKCIYDKNEKVIENAVKGVLIGTSLKVDEGFGWDHFLRKKKEKKRYLKDCITRQFYFHVKLVFSCCLVDEGIQLTIHLYGGSETSDFRNHGISCVKCGKKAVIGVGDCFHPHCLKCGREDNALMAQKEPVFSKNKQQLFQCSCCCGIYWGFHPIEVTSLYKKPKSKKRLWQRTLALHEEAQRLSIQGKRKKFKRQLYTSDFGAASKQEGDLTRVVRLSRRSQNYDMIMKKVKDVNEVRITMALIVDGFLIEEPYTINHKKDINFVLKTLENDTSMAETIYLDYGENPILFYEKGREMCPFQEYKSRHGQ